MMPKLKTSSTRGAKRRDTIARWIITLGGVAVIASVIAILALIASVTLPLARSPRAATIAQCASPSPLFSSAGKNAGGEEVLRLGIDLDIGGAACTGIFWRRDGTVVWIDLPTCKSIHQETMKSPGDGQAALCRVESLGENVYALLWSDGSGSLVEATAAKNADGVHRSVRALGAIAAEKNAAPFAADAAGFIRRSESGAVTLATAQADGTIHIQRQTTGASLLDEDETVTHHAILRDEILADVAVMAMNRDGDTLYAGTRDGRLVRWKLDSEAQVAQREVVRAFADGRPITALALVFGDVSLAVGDARGGLSVWSPVNADGTRKLYLIHQLQPHAAAIREIIPSGRTKSLLSVDADGEIHLDHITSERHLVSIPPDNAEAGDGARIALGVRGDALLRMTPDGQMAAWRIEGGCAEISLKTLFGRVHYEGYDRPEFVWQTTGGEDFEAKYGIVPLLFGTLKGTFYAMLLAGPMALFGAVYVSYLTTPGFRKFIKPLVEIMASVPSVVIGFLVALWLAPILERWILAFFTGLMTVPAVFFGFLVFWQLVRRHDWAKRVEHGHEFLVALPVLLLGVAAAAWLAGPLESLLFGGNFRHWLYEGPLRMQYAQRNCIVIAFGLGFTVIPIIFSIAEDALSNVPYGMTAASMAVGASRWQTLWRVVLPSASPGIFAAMMIGFGRAVGETMIVLMATGNTPIMDWSPLNGMRTLSANIAVEIPEAPVGGTLYRVLFLCAVLLFILTFVVNTSAELVRQRLRKRFGKF